ncbi:MAG: hypothetical protein ABEJ85_04400 [Haloarculaceae archaeon]
MAERREKQFRGISRRLAVKYLENLGGDRDAERSDDDTDVVVGDDWTATLTAEKVGVGGSLSLTEVTVVFEGDSLDDLVEAFSQKAMRAGG